MPLWCDIIKNSTNVREIPTKVSKRDDKESERVELQSKTGVLDVWLHITNGACLINISALSYAKRGV